MYKTAILLLAFASCTFGASTKQSNNIVRPCPELDPKCIGDNLQANSYCTTRDLSWVPQSFLVKYFRFETPYFNASYIDNDLVIQNMDQCYVSEFFYDLDTDVAVLSVDCPDMILSSNRTLIQHKSMEEDTFYSYSCTWQYPMIRMTANLKADAIDICNANVFTDVVEMPKFIVKPNDQPTQDFLTSDLSYLDIYERETFSYRGQPMFKRVISGSYCNFGCSNQ